MSIMNLFWLSAGLRIRIHFIRIRIQRFRLNTNPDRNPIRIQGFNDQKIEKKLQLKNFFKFFFFKNCNLPTLGLHIVRPSYRRSLQLSKEAIQHFKIWTLKKILLLWAIFALLDPDPDPLTRVKIRIQSGSATLVIRIRIC